MEKSTKTVLVLILISVTLGVVGQLSMKSGMKSVGKIELSQMLFTSKLFQVILNPLVIFGMILYMSAAIVWLVVLSKAELSYAYPMFALGYVITSVIAWLLFKENMTLFRFFGILMIMSGVYLIALKR